MSQEQPQRPQDSTTTKDQDQENNLQQEQSQESHPHDVTQEPIKYGDVFQVSGDLSDQPITPKDAAVLQSAETTVFGGVQQGGPAATVTAAATVNQRAGLVGQADDDESGGGGGGDKVVTVTATDYPGTRVITESVAGQVLGQYYQPMPAQGTNVQGQVTIGQALEAAAQAAGNKPVDQSDAAAIQAAEVRASGTNAIMPGGVAAAAQSAASFNAALQGDEGKIKLSDVLTNASQKLPGDRAATRADAEGVVAAELRNNPMLATHPGGVAASVAAAVRLNEGTRGGT